MSLTNGNAIQGLHNQQNQLEAKKGENKILVELGESLLTTMKTKTPTQARSDLLQYINLLAASLGHSEPFRTFADARAWFVKGSFIKIND
jgi:hypothetical protein